MDYFDRDGNEIEFERWLMLFEDRRYQVLAYDVVGAYAISTVWLGLDHNFGLDGPPIIFETMIFRQPQLGIQRRGDSVEGRRYATEEEAIIGHRDLINEVSLLSALEEVELEG